MIPANTLGYIEKIGGKKKMGFIIRLTIDMPIAHKPSRPIADQVSTGARLHSGLIWCRQRLLDVGVLTGKEALVGGPGECSIHKLICAICFSMGMMPRAVAQTWML